VGYPDWADIRNSNFARTRFFPLIDEDMPTFMGLPLAISPADLQGMAAVIIDAPPRSCT
jgi:agmatinase